MPEHPLVEVKRTHREQASSAAFTERHAVGHGLCGDYARDGATPAVADIDEGGPVGKGELGPVGGVARRGAGF